jgi:signal peptidase I
MACSEPIREQHKRDLAVEVLRAAGQVRLAARGYSMLPSLWPGDVLTIRAATFEQLTAADLVLYSRDGRFFIHRVLRRGQVDGQLRWVTRGDSMPHPDQPVSADEVLGKVVAVERDGQALEKVPACTAFVRAIGLALAWGRLRSVILRLRQRSAANELEVVSDGAVSL